MDSARKPAIHSSNTQSADTPFCQPSTDFNMDDVYHFCTKI